MAVFQIGRLFADHDVDITSSSWSGRRWSVSGDVVLSGANRVDEGVAVREQIEGLAVSSDEPFVVVQWSEDPTVDGFYRLLGMRISIGQTHLTDGNISWSAELERVTARQQPPLESICSWQLLTNTRSVTSGTFSTSSVPQHAVPSTAWDYGPVSGTVSGSGSSIDTLTTTEGVLNVARVVTVPATGIYGWSVDPSDYYMGACRVTTDYGAATDKLVFGQGYSETTQNWMVSNGFVRFSLVSNNIRVEFWTGSTWHRPNATDFRVKGHTTALVPRLMTVLRNSPECVSVRVLYSVVTGVRVYADLTLLRGSGVVYGFMSTPPLSSSWATAFTLGVEATATTACTAVTGGFRATTADASSYVFALTSGAPAVTDDTGVGAINTTATATSLSFGITGGSTTLAPLRVLEFFARRSETTRVVDR